jgi:ribosome-associated translation inhibitor RaiA
MKIKGISRNYFNKRIKWEIIMDKVKTVNAQIPFEKLTEGMIFGEDVMDKEGKLLVSKNAVLTQNTLDRLRKFSSKKAFYIKVTESQIDIKTVVKLENGEYKELSSSEIKIEYTKERLVIKEKFDEMHKSIKKSFDELSRNNNGSEIKKELEKTIFQSIQNFLMKYLM